MWFRLGMSPRREGSRGGFDSRYLQYADVVKLANTLALEASTQKVRVRVPSSAELEQMSIGEMRWTANPPAVKTAEVRILLVPYILV